MTVTDGNGNPIMDLEGAKARIKELEKALDNSIEILLKRDSQLEAHERRIVQLENALAAKDQA